MLYNERCVAAAQTGLFARDQAADGGEVKTLKKTYVKSHRTYKVTFELPEAELPEGVAIESIHLVGEFSDWKHGAMPMTRGPDGTFRLTLELEPGRAAQFRYLINGQQWYNDWHADAYVLNAYGADNCVVVTPSEPET